MPLFRRANWPRDHRDEFVAGALVGAVVIVLGYASGIGASTASGGAEAAAPPPSSPSATAPPNIAPGDSGAQSPGSGTGGVGGDTGGWTGQVPVGTGELPVYGGTGSGTGTGGHPGHAGHGTSPSPTPTLPPATSPSPAPSSSPSPSGSEPPTDDATCADGEVRLVAPLLTGVTQPLFGLLNGTDGSGTDATGADDDMTPEPTASPCVGLAPLSSLLGGSSSSPSPSASPLSEATP